MKKLIIFLVFMGNGLMAQNVTQAGVHSHNDYLQNVPFWKAYSAGANSIEADVFLIENDLYVAHTRKEIDTLRTLEALYLEPLKEALTLGFDGAEELVLLIDIKSEPYTTLQTLNGILQNYPSITGSDRVTIAISGNRPKPPEYLNYPKYIFFDHQNLQPLQNPAILQKIALVSLSFRNFSEWSGEGAMTSEDRKRITAVIEKAHAFNKPFRFWATPDSELAWKAFVDLGVDFINTDKPMECIKFLDTP